MKGKLALVGVVLVLGGVGAPPASAAGGTIVGGQNASNGEWPWTAYLNGTIYSCGGSLIDARWVLTAAHCVVLIGPSVPSIPAPHISATVGRTDLNNTSQGRTIRGLRAIVHPRFNGGTLQNDVALIELSSAATGVPTIKVAGAGEEPLWSTGTTSTVVGWGATAESGASSDILKEVEIPILADPTCSQYVDGFDAATMLCAGLIGVGGKDSCQGDSGGPLMVPANGGIWRQAGIVSWGKGCARPNDPGVYSRIGAAGLRNFVAQYVPTAIGSGATRSAPPTPTVVKKKKKATKRKKARKRTPRKRSRG